MSEPCEELHWRKPGPGVQEKCWCCGEDCDWCAPEEDFHSPLIPLHWCMACKMGGYLQENGTRCGPCYE